MLETKSYDESSRPPAAISRRRFIKLAVAAGLLAGCKPAQQPAIGTIAIEPTAVEPTAVSPTSMPEPTNAQTETPVPPTEPAEEPAPAADMPRLMEHLHWLGHSSFRFDGPPTIYIDLTTATSNSPPADVILISHDHSDHYAPTALKRVSGPETIIVTTPDIAQALEGTDVVYGEVRALRAGEQVTVGAVVIAGVPAYNVNKAYHPLEAGYLGFIVTFEEERLYFAGDTDHIPEMADIECDVALLPIGGTYTMDMKEAAQAAAEIGAKVTVPMHERSADPEEFRDLCECEVVVMETEF